LPRVYALNESEHSVVLSERHAGRSCKEFLALVGLRVPVDNGMVALAGAGSKLLENEFLSAGNLQKRKILHGRTNENQIVILGVVQRKETSSFDADAAAEQAEDAIELMDCQDFANAGVVVENVGP
jgi:hypothetical protein